MGWVWNNFDNFARDRRNRIALRRPPKGVFGERCIRSVVRERWPQRTAVAWRPGECVRLRPDCRGIPDSCRCEADGGRQVEAGLLPDEDTTDAGKRRSIRSIFASFHSFNHSFPIFLHNSLLCRRHPSPFGYSPLVFNAQKRHAMPRRAGAKRNGEVDRLDGTRRY